MEVEMRWQSVWVSALLLVAAAGVFADTFPEVMFILDGSGSMAQADRSGETKMDAAKKVLNQVVPEIPPEVKAGLTVYGHRTPKDCQDVQVIIPPGSDDRGALLTKANAIQPTGMTPISLAVTQTAELLKGRDAETTIILISDGEETCGGDPCAVVRALKAAGVKFVMHVVGLDVNAVAKTQLDCMAAEGGGEYFAATDAASLLAALEKVRAGIVQKVEKAKTTVVRKKTKLGKLQITMPGEALRALAGFRLIRAADGKVMKESELSSTDSTHPLIEGAYELELLFANPNYKPADVVPIGQFNVVGGEVTTVAFGGIAFNIADGLEDNNVQAVVVMDAATQTPLLQTTYNGNGYYLFKPKALLPGAYDVAIQYSRSEMPTVMAENLEVAAGALAYVTLDTGIELIQPPETSVTGWSLIPAGAKEPIIQVTRRHDNQEPLWRRFMTPPGVYDLYVTVRGMDEPLPVGEGIEIKKGETLRFDTGL
ncbi:MAG: VWA domain-containing protein [Spartobacteria bacterium]|nr:VWA domain-containing protein [Spartobacteria bacterium]